MNNGPRAITSTMYKHVQFLDKLFSPSITNVEEAIIQQKYDRFSEEHSIDWLQVTDMEHGLNASSNSSSIPIKMV